MLVCLIVVYRCITLRVHASNMCTNITHFMAHDTLLVYLNGHFVFVCAIQTSVQHYMDSSALSELHIPMPWNTFIA